MASLGCVLRDLLFIGARRRSVTGSPEKSHRHPWPTHLPYPDGRSSMNRPWRCGIVFGVVAVALARAGTAADPTGFRFEVTVAAGLLPKPTDGRLLVVLGKPT